MRSACLHAAGHVHWRWFAGTILEVASVSEFEKDLRKKKEGTDTLNQNQENSTKPAVPAEGENNAPAAPAKKRISAVYRPQNRTQKRPAGNRRSETGKTEQRFRHAGETDDKQRAGSTGKGS